MILVSSPFQRFPVIPSDRKKTPWLTSMPEDAIAIADTRQPRQAHVKCRDLWARSLPGQDPLSFDGKDPKDPIRWVVPLPRIPVANEGLGWDSLLKME